MNATMCLGRKIRLYPNAAQAQRLEQTVGACRWLWNHLLELNKARYEAEKKFIFGREMSAMLPGLKQNYCWLREAPSYSLVRVTKTLERAIVDSFKSARGFPKVKRKSLTFGSFYLSNQAVLFQDTALVMAKIGEIAFRGDISGLGKIMSATVSKSGAEWYCTIVHEVVCAEAVQPAEIVGIDLGLSHLVTTSDGQVFDNPRPLNKAAKRVARLQRQLERCEKGSNNSKKRQLRLHKAHRKVARIRADHLHKMTTKLVAKADVVAMEDLNVKGLCRTKMAGSMADAAFGEIERQLQYKTKLHGKTLVQADRFFPSTQLCSACGAKQKMPLSVRTYRCSCGMEMDRDVNAALNLKAWAVNQLGAGCSEVTPEESTLPGEGVSPPRRGSLSQEPSGRAPTESQVSKFQQQSMELAA